MNLRNIIHVHHHLTYYINGIIIQGPEDRREIGE